MHKLEPVKRFLEKGTGIGIPDQDDALSRVKPVSPKRMKCKADGYIPNNQRVATLFYRDVIRFDLNGDPAALIEAVFNANGWGKAWRNGIYDFVHYHPRTHEVLGIARGEATLRIGGNHGATLKVKAGDVILVPAGVGHECLAATSEFLVVGAYPPQGVYSECRGSFQEYKKAQSQVLRVPRPKKDPVHGNKIPK